MPDRQRRQTKAQTIPIFVISLASAPLRRERICRHLDGLGLEYELIEAVDGRLLSEQELRRLAGGADRFPPGVVGCYASHLAAYRRILETGAEAGLILEDDVRLNARFVPVIKEGFDCTKFDIMYLDCMEKNTHGPVFYNVRAPTAIGHGFRFFPLSDGPQGAFALVVTAKTAQRRLDCALPMLDHIDVYDQLPCKFRFAALIKPKAAYFSEDSLVSYTSNRDMSANRPRFGRLRKTSLFRLVREYARREHWQAVRIARQLRREGKLPASGSWRPIPASILGEVSGAPLDVR